MKPTKKMKSICCPNHGEPLEGIGFPIPRKGKGTCPVSGVPFDFEVELDQNTMTRDKDGKPLKSKGWQITGDDK